jgi:hypothetical protein
MANLGCRAGCFHLFVIAVAGMSIMRACTSYVSAGFVWSLIKAQAAEVLKKDVGKIAPGGGFRVKFKARRGVRVA